MNLDEMRWINDDSSHQNQAHSTFIEQTNLTVNSFLFSPLSFTHSFFFTALVCDTVTSLVVYAWYVIFISHFRTQFINSAKDDDKEDDLLIDPRALPTQDDEFHNSNALSFDLEEEVFTPGLKTSDDGVENRKASMTKGVRKQANAVDVKGGGSGFVPYVEDKLKLKLKRSAVQTSEVSSILKSDQIDLIASWLPGERETGTHSLESP